MPAAAVIPAPGAYINVVAVKEFVVDSIKKSFLEQSVKLLSLFGAMNFEKMESLHTGNRLNLSAWNKLTQILSFSKESMIDKDVRGRLYSLERGEILRPSEDKQMRKHSPSVFQLIKNESWGIEDD